MGMQLTRNDSRQVKQQIPFDFVLEELEPLSPITKPFFGCTGVYVGEKIVLILRNKSKEPESNGVWLATTYEHHESLKRDFPSMRSIGVLGEGTTGWQVLHVKDADFEASVMKACELILSGDPRIGKVPKRKPMKPTKKSKTSRKATKDPVSRVRKRSALNRDDD